MSEGELQREIMLAVTKAGARIFRNNVGALEWKPGQWLHYGVCNPGGSDLIGWTVVNGVAVFTAIEVKIGKRKPTEEQQRFLDAVKAAGGIAIVGRSVDQVLRELEL